MKKILRIVVSAGIILLGSSCATIPRTESARQPNQVGTNFGGKFKPMGYAITLDGRYLFHSNGSNDFMGELKMDPNVQLQAIDSQGKIHVTMANQTYEIGRVIMDTPLIRTMNGEKITFYDTELNDLARLSWSHDDLQKNGVRYELKFWPPLKVFLVEWSTDTCEDPLSEGTVLIDDAMTIINLKEAMQKTKKDLPDQNLLSQVLGIKLNDKLLAGITMSGTDVDISIRASQESLPHAKKSAVVKVSTEQVDVMKLISGNRFFKEAYFEVPNKQCD